MLTLDLEDCVLANLALSRGAWHLVRPEARCHELVRAGAPSGPGRSEPFHAALAQGLPLDPIADPGGSSPGLSDHPHGPAAGLGARAAGVQTAGPGVNAELPKNKVQVHYRVLQPVVAKSAAFYPMKIYSIHE